MADGSILRIPYDDETDLDANTPLSAELVYDTDNAEVRYGDGTTLGGIVLAKKSDLGSGDASGITYTPAVATDWDSDVDPGDVDDALDQLAERIDDVEGAGYLTSVDAAIVTYTPAVATDWDSDADPGNVDDALDQLAERVDDVEAGVPALVSNIPLAVFVPPGEPPSANFATFDTRNQHPVLDFDAATDESIMFTGILGRHYAGGGVTVNLHITDTNDTNAAHASYWDVSFERLTAQDLDADSFAAVQSNHVHPNGTSGIPVICSIPFTDGAQMDSVAAGELFRLKVTRDANNGSDDWANDAELLAVEIVET